MNALMKVNYQKGWLVLSVILLFQMVGLFLLNVAKLGILMHGSVLL